MEIKCARHLGAIWGSQPPCMHAWDRDPGSRPGAGPGIYGPGPKALAHGPKMAAPPGWGRRGRGNMDYLSRGGAVGTLGGAGVLEVWGEGVSLGDEEGSAWRTKLTNHGLNRAAYIYIYIHVCVYIDMTSIWAWPGH